MTVAVASFLVWRTKARTRSLQLLPPLPLLPQLPLLFRVPRRLQQDSGGGSYSYNHNVRDIDPPSATTGLRDGLWPLHHYHSTIINNRQHQSWTLRTKLNTSAGRHHQYRYKHSTYRYISASSTSSSKEVEAGNQGEYAEAVEEVDDWVFESDEILYDQSNNNNNGSNSDNTGFVQSWMDMKDRLLAAPLGSLWQTTAAGCFFEAEKLLNALRKHSELVKALTPQRRLEIIFDVLDRLSNEMEFVAKVDDKVDERVNEAPLLPSSLSSSSYTPPPTTTSPSSLSQQAAPVPLPRFDASVLNHVLLAWLKFIVAETGTHTTTDLLHQKQLARKGGGSFGWRGSTAVSTNPTSQHPTSSSRDTGCLLLDIDKVLAKVDRYLDVGLVEPSTKPYTIVVDAMNKTVGDPQRVGPYRADQIFQRLMTKANTSATTASSSPYYPMNRLMIDSMIQIWACSWLPESGRRAEDYLNLFKQEHRKKSAKKSLRPSATLYCGVMEAHGRSTEPRAAFRRIQQLLIEMNNYDDYGDTSHEKDTPEDHQNQKQTSHHSTIVYNRICHALSDCCLPEAVQAAQNILDEMCHQFLPRTSATDANAEDRNNNDHHTKQMPKPDCRIFNTVLSAWGRLGQTEKAVAIFERMERLADELGNDSIRPNSITLAGLTWAFAKVGDTARAEDTTRRLIRQMDQTASPSSSNNIGQRSVWDGILVAWAQSKDPQAHQYISRVIEKLLQLAKDKQVDGSIITTFTLNTLLRCYAVQGTTQGAELAERLFNWMEKHNVLRPDFMSYQWLILAWCNAGKPECGEKVLRDFCLAIRQGRMVQSSIDQSHFNIVIDAWSNSHHPQAHQRAAGVFDLMESVHIMPNVVSYNSLIFAWSRCQTFDSVKPVLQLFEKMKQQWRNGDEFAKPTTRSYNAVIWAMGQSKDPISLQLAQSYFMEMKKYSVHRDAKVYNSLMSVYAKHQLPDKVEDLFQALRSAYESTGHYETLRSDMEAHTTRLQAWSKAGNPALAAESLRDWIKACEEMTTATAEKDLRPRTQAFAAVLIAWLRSPSTRDVDAGVMADRGLREMKELAESGRFECFPNLQCYSTVIASYRKAKSPNAGQRALELLEELKGAARTDAKMEPSFSVYAGVLQAILRSCGGHQHDYNGKDRQEESYRSIRLLFDELAAKEASFWIGSDAENKHTLRQFVFIRLDLGEYCRSPHKEELLCDLDRLEAKVAQIGLSSHPRKRMTKGHRPA